ncbi:hypothetical protein RUND412_007141, partial [Rhizina undulata]
AAVAKPGKQKQSDQEIDSSPRLQQRKIEKFGIFASVYISPLNTFAREAGSYTTNLQSRYEEHGTNIALELAYEDYKAKEQLYNQEAAELIFSTKNRGRPPTDMDLHGLFVKEAEAKVLQCLAQAIEEREIGKLEVIVGKELHSCLGIAKIKPAIIKMCGNFGLRYSAPARQGVIDIDFDDILNVLGHLGDANNNGVEDDTLFHN